MRVGDLAQKDWRVALADEKVSDKPAIRHETIYKIV